MRRSVTAETADLSARPGFEVNPELLSMARAESQMGSGTSTSTSTSTATPGTSEPAGGSTTTYRTRTLGEDTTP